jgi:hypothetical protein
MMMEEEIERTKKEIRRIEDACEKVEQTLENVVQGNGLNTSAAENMDQNGIIQGDVEKMEDITGEAQSMETAKVDSSEQPWFSNENLLRLWNGN